MTKQETVAHLPTFNVKSIVVDVIRISKSIR